MGQNGPLICCGERARAGGSRAVLPARAQVNMRWSKQASVAGTTARVQPHPCPSAKATKACSLLPTLRCHVLLTSAYMQSHGYAGGQGDRGQSQQRNVSHRRRQRRLGEGPRGCWRGTSPPSRGRMHSAIALARSATVQPGGHCGTTHWTRAGVWRYGCPLLAGGLLLHARTADGRHPCPRPQYAPYFANCDGAAVSFSVRVAAYNLKPDGSRDYLSVGETELDVVYWVRGGGRRRRQGCCGMAEAQGRVWWRSSPPSKCTGPSLQLDRSGSRRIHGLLLPFSPPPRSCLRCLRR